MWLSIVVSVQLVCIIYGQLSRLLLRQVTILVLIDFDLFVDLFKSTGIHLCGCHELAHPAFELQLLDFFRRQILILLLNLRLNISRQFLHISQNFDLLWPLLHQLLRIRVLIVISVWWGCKTDIKWCHVAVRSAYRHYERNLLADLLFSTNRWVQTLQIVMLSILLGQWVPGLLNCDSTRVRVVVERVCG